MIIGNGLIAKALQKIDCEELVFFASGVSNSLENRETEFIREEKLLVENLHHFSSKKFIYFSSCSIYDSTKKDSQYVIHKLKMEQLIRQNANTYLIARVSNAVGNGGNPTTLMNYLVHAIKNNNQITIHTKASRNFIDVDDIASIVYEILIEDKIYNSIINIAYPKNYSIEEIVKTIEKELNIKANTKSVNEGINYNIEIKVVDNYFSKYKVENYLSHLITKYYV